MAFTTNIFSGVLWEQSDLMLEDVDRIEVIRGAGGTMWAANAVNGVINVIAKKAYFSKAVSTIKATAVNQDKNFHRIASVRASGRNSPFSGINPRAL